MISKRQIPYTKPSTNIIVSEEGGGERVMKTVKILAVFAGSSCNLAIIKFLVAGLEQVP